MPSSNIACSSIYGDNDNFNGDGYSDLKLRSEYSQLIDLVQFDRESQQIGIPAAIWILREHGDSHFTLLSFSRLRRQATRNSELYTDVVAFSTTSLSYRSTSRARTPVVHGLLENQSRDPYTSLATVLTNVFTNLTFIYMADEWSTMMSL
jgi:hypothetical protein